MNLYFDINISLFFLHHNIVSVSVFCSFQNSEKGIQIHERKALNTEFYINICMYSPTEIGMDDVIPFHCLLKMYLENDSNNFRVEYSKMNVLSTMSITERTGLFAQYKAKLVARDIFMSLTYMMDLLPHINNLNVSYQMSVMDSYDNDIKSRLSLFTRHTGESCLSKADQCNYCSTKDSGQLILKIFVKDTVNQPSRGHNVHILAWK